MLLCYCTTQFLSYLSLTHYQLEQVPISRNFETCEAYDREVLLNIKTKWVRRVRCIVMLSVFTGKPMRVIGEGQHVYYWGFFCPLHPCFFNATFIMFVF